MPVVSCPNCRGELDLDAADLGHLVACPQCRDTFIAESKKTAPPLAARAPDPPAGEERVVRCQRCDGQVTVSAADLGHEVTCPLCDRGFIAQSEGEGLPRYDDRPRRRSRNGDSEAGGGDQDLVEYAKRECNAAGSGLQVIGGLMLVLSPLQLLQVLMGGQRPGGRGAAPTDEVLRIGLFLGAYLFITVLGILQIVGGRQMRRAKSWGLCLAACISGVLSFGPFCLGLVFGVMGFVKLTNPRVKRGFQLNNPHYDPDS